MAFLARSLAETNRSRFFPDVLNCLVGSIVLSFASQLRSRPVVFFERTMGQLFFEERDRRRDLVGFQSDGSLARDSDLCTNSYMPAVEAS